MYDCLVYKVTCVDVGEYEDIGILSLREACRIEFETKHAVCLTPVSGRFGKLSFDEAVKLDRLDN